MFGILEGSHAGRDFARCLDISDVWDFNQYRIDPEKMDFGELTAFFGTLSENKDYKKGLKGLRF